VEGGEGDITKSTTNTAKYVEVKVTMAQPESHTQCIRHFLAVTTKYTTWAGSKTPEPTNQRRGGFGSMTKGLSVYHIRSTKKKKKTKKVEYISF
jgi:hypothetical protein